jgi:O-antigen/teichoic acid export membrane protein
MVRESGTAGVALGLAMPGGDSRMIGDSGTRAAPFATEYLKTDLKGRTIRGGAATFVGQAVKFFLQLASTMVLARILTPQDFGLIAMVAAVTGFTMAFKDLGLSMATVQRAQVSHDQVSTLFWINLGISLLLAMGTVGLSPVVVWFYGEPKLLWIMIVLAAGFVFGGLTVQHQALLRRQMRMLALAVIDISALGAGIVVAIICASRGLRYWSLVLMQITMACITAAGVWISSGWRPGWPVRRSGIRAMLAFGGNLTGFSVVNYFVRNLDNVLIGRYWGARSLGVYSRAYSLLLFPIGQITSPITAVAVPALSRLQEDPERYRGFYLKSLRLISYISMPVVAAMWVLSSEIVRLVLGEEWIDAGPIFRILAIAAIWQSVGSTVGWVYTSLGQTRRMFIWACIAAPLIALSFLIGLRWGAVGVATAYALCCTALLVPQFSFAVKYSPISVRDVFLSMRYPFAASILVGLAMSIAHAYLAGFHSIWVIAGSLAGGGFVFLLLVLGCRSFRSDVNDFARMAIMVVRSREQQ